MTQVRRISWVLWGRSADADTSGILVPLSDSRPTFFLLERFLFRLKQFCFADGEAIRQ
ncbi:hypothetical protein QBK99_08245 [Corticibacterium sp. UT-5YL-CI-8]|nr:hypothetical protein [Tianweitania sp. UT-5YL-CI-8]